MPIKGDVEGEKRRIRKVKTDELIRKIFFEIKRDIFEPMMQEQCPSKKYSNV